jgi:dihydrofolate reductase
VSIDGVVGDPVGKENSGLGNWTGPFSRGPEGDRFKHEELQAADSLIFGHVTYEAFAAAWPRMKDEAGFADRMNRLPKMLASTTLKNPSWGDTTIWNRDIVSTARTFRAQGDGTALIYGSASVIHQLAPCRAHRRISPHDLSDDLGSREAPLPGRDEVHPDAGGEPAVRRRYLTQARGD